METHRLICHPDTPAASVSSIVVAAEWTGDWLSLTYALKDAGRVRWPQQEGGERRDGLWQTTCAECFIRPHDGPAYLEFNFAPSGSWAAYAFADYRVDPAHLRMSLAPQIEAEHGILSVTLPLERRRGRMGLSMVIEELDGTRSFWALAHPPGAPDFHHPACFAAAVAAPGGP